MARNAAVTTRVSAKTKSRLGALARATSRSEAFLAAEAIEAYIETNAWQVAEIRRGLAEAKAGTPGIPHEEVEAWVRSWGKRNELPRPKARR